MVSLSELSTKLELRDTDTILVSVVLPVPEVLPLVAETFKSTVALFVGCAGDAVDGTWIEDVGLTADPELDVRIVCDDVVLSVLLAELELLDTDAIRVADTESVDLSVVTEDVLVIVWTF